MRNGLVIFDFFVDVIIELELFVIFDFKIEIFFLNILRFSCVKWMEQGEIVVLVLSGFFDFFCYFFLILMGFIYYIVVKNVLIVVQFEFKDNGNICFNFLEFVYWIGGCRISLFFSVW